MAAYVKNVVQKLRISLGEIRFQFTATNFQAIYVYEVYDVLIDCKLRYLTTVKDGEKVLYIRVMNKVQTTI